MGSLRYTKNSPDRLFLRRHRGLIPKPEGSNQGYLRTM